jgi:hypothetical protein
LTPVTPVTEEGLTYRHSVLLLAGVLVLWALGCTFFWCLVAVNPGEGEASSLTLRGSTIHEVEALGLTIPPRHAIHRSSRERAGDVSIEAERDWRRRIL